MTPTQVCINGCNVLSCTDFALSFKNRVLRKLVMLEEKIDQLLDLNKIKQDAVFSNIPFRFLLDVRSCGIQ